MSDEKRRGLGRFLDWVNADTELPSLAQLEQAHGHDDHAEAHAAHGAAEENSHAAHQVPHQEVPAHTTDEANLAQADTEEPAAEYEYLKNTKEEDMEYPDPVVLPEEMATRALAPVSVKKRKQATATVNVLYTLLAGLCALVMIAVLLATVSQMPAFGSDTNPTVNEVYDKYVNEGVEDTGAVNLVAGMILDYRAFDTLGESLMLFTATMGVIMLIRKPGKSPNSGHGRKEGEG